MQRDLAYKYIRLDLKKDSSLLKNNDYKQKNSLKYIVNSPLQSPSRKFTLKNKQISKILKEQNTNLKQQNNFLLQKLRTFIQNQNYHSEKSARYQGIIRQLNIHNEEIRSEIDRVQRQTDDQILKMQHKMSLLIRMKSCEEKPNKNKDQQIPSISKKQSLQSEKSTETKTDIYSIQSPRSTQPGISKIDPKNTLQKQKSQNFMIG